jgi:predicted transcriptional regulator
LEAAVRVRDVMSSPVVCVPPDSRLKETADLLVTQGISAVPVVDGGGLVGILSEADLLPLELLAPEEVLVGGGLLCWRQAAAAEPAGQPATTVMRCRL